MMPFASGWQPSRRIRAQRSRCSSACSLGVLLRWIVVDVIKNQVPQNLSVIIARIVVALIATIFVFSGYWQKVKDQPAGMRFLNALVYGVSIDALVGPWTY